MKTKITFKTASILLLGVILASACTQSYSQTPSGTPTSIPTGLFVSPFPSSQSPLEIIAALGTETAQAGTATAGGTVVATDTAGTPSTGVAATDTPAVTTPGTQAATLLPVTVIPGGSTFTPTTSTGGTVVVPTISGTPVPVPSSYALQKGEFPFCIARRFNIDPFELLTANNLTVDQGQIYQPGLVLTIPQNAGSFPPPRALHAHPSTWTVDPGDTFNSISCWYGDITPDQIAAANNMATTATLTTGATLTIP
ncbi:MAG TPA: LysM peptidoglycan-binding domain-containing protein [Anaerolineales bacterium]